MHDIAGKGIANPVATIWSGAMMLDFLKTPDLGGVGDTTAVGKAIAAAI